MATAAGTYPVDWVFDVVLHDGRTIGIRPIRPDDADGLRGLLDRMGPESIYYRFFRYRTDFSDEELAYFATLDYYDRMAFVATTDEGIIGVGRYDQLAEEPGIAEVAFAVADDHQGHGVGTRLLEQMTAYARTRGVSGFRALVLHDNHAMLRMFRNGGFNIHRELDEGVYTVDFPTEASDETLAVMYENERRATAASMMPLFYPHSIAVIGASREPKSIGGRLFKNLIEGDFTGPVYPVNPKAPVVRSVKAYPSVADIPDPVDLAFIVVPAPFVIPAVKECDAKGVRGLVIISAGFAETGEAGRRQEAILLETVRDGGMRMVGPNCMGLLNTDPAVSVNGQFGPIFPPRGNVAMSSQSGALGIAILDYATALNIGISSFVSVGNKADVSGNDLLLYWENDPSTDVILLYLESFGNPRKFARLARRIGRTKPIVAMKSGRTSAGAKAASSHTGSLASLDVAVDALFHQTGVIRTRTLEELFDVTTLLANQPIPEGRRVAILTNAGGPGILAVDALVSEGLNVPELSEELQNGLRANLAPEASVSNPIDMIASAGPDQYRACLDLLVRSDEVDAVMAIYIPAAPEGMEEVATALGEAGAASAGLKTFLTVFMRSAGKPPDASAIAARVPTYSFPERAARALGAAIRYGEWRDRPIGSIVHFDDIDVVAARAIVAEALESMDSEGGWLDPQRVDALLRTHGFSPPRSAIAASRDEAIKIAASLDGPVALKVVSEAALHKSDVGGVALDKFGDEEVGDAYDQVTSVADDAAGAFVQEMIEPGHEVLIGMTEDPNFGPLIVFGLGGVFVELMKDVAFRIHPLTDLDATEMIGSIRSARLLEGYRGGKAGDIDAIKAALLRISALIEAVPEIAEMDLNPVIVHGPGEGVRVVDARIRVRRVEGEWLPTRRDIPSEV